MIRFAFPDLGDRGCSALRGDAKRTGIRQSALKSNSFTIQFLSFEGISDYNPHAIQFPSFGLQFSAISDVYRKTSIPTSELTLQLCPTVARHLDLA